VTSTNFSPKFLALYGFQGGAIAVPAKVAPSVITRLVRLCRKRNFK